MNSSRFRIESGKGAPLVLIAGPCVIESRDLVMKTAEAVKKTALAHGLQVIFKSSFRKANRTSSRGFTGIGTDEGLKILEEAKTGIGVPVLTDIHEAHEAATVAEVADVLQIPAFLSRQTDLLQAAGETGRAVNIKKGQFMAPSDMKFAAEKVTRTGNRHLFLTERGTTFGYHNLVVDMRSFPLLRALGFPVFFDATHSVQLPSQDSSGASSGNPEFILPLARAAIGAGCDGLFLEVHPDPASALSDAASQLPLDQLENVIRQVKAIHASVERFREEGT
ncbi:MAG: 3-deoxy-8-phosphooctulonate synthase [Ignavibacteria bacterium]|nr:3-deoxy-8-phosphooctulonate synthase [Ignavibacteria bacterium]